MFDLIKQKVSLLDVLEQDLGVTFRLIGEKNWAINGRKDEEACPFCGHHECFRVKHEENDNASSFYKCFSCGESGDVIAWRAKKNSCDMSKAAKELASEYGIKIPNDYSPVQQVFNLAADYYHACMTDACNRPYPVLNGLTPLRYQTEVRKRKLETITKHKLGYSDGGLIDYLDSLGIDSETIEKSGLMSSKTKKDFLPSNCFIYPHFVKGKVSHFTFKDPLKKIQYQLPKRFSLNGYLFYGQDSIQDSTSIALVEGENDRLAMVECGGTATMAIIGQISGEQLDWLREHCKTKRIVTVFDPDDAGDGYREKLEMLRRCFTDLIHILPPNGKDIDEHLSNGASLLDIVAKNRINVEVKPLPGKKPATTMPWDEVILAPKENREPVTDAEISTPQLEQQTPPELVTDLSEGMSVVGPAPEQYAPPVIPTDFSSQSKSGESEVVEVENSSVIIMKNCYYKVVYKDGLPSYVRLSNFLLELRYVFIDEEMGDRRREMLVHRCDGYKSDVFEMDSDTKVSIKSFKTLMAKVADAEWTGNENDLSNMWRLIYTVYPEIMIRIVRQVGRNDRHRCWIFKNILITDSGHQIKPDDNGVFWVNGKNNGIKIKSISDSEDDFSVIPSLVTDLTKQESNEILTQVLRRLSLNFKNPGHALMVIGWAYSNMYSNDIYKADGGFGSLMIWGSGGQGKSTIARWIQKFFGLTDKMASSSVQQLKSATGFMRKGAYYSSIPMLLDEVRADEYTTPYLGLIRSWYDREARTMADRDNKSMIRTLPIRSTLMMAGEDLPADAATKQRCIMIRLPKSDDGHKTQLAENFKFFESHSTVFSSVLYYWILDACNKDTKSILAGIRQLDAALVDAGCSNRVSKVWSSAAYFARELATNVFPDFDFLDYIIKTCTQEQEQQKNDNAIHNFFENLASIHAQPNSKITDGHFVKTGRQINLWFPAIFKEVDDSIRSNRGKWSKNALLKAIKEEPFYVCDNRKIAIGISGMRKTVLTLDLDKCPESLQTLVGYDPQFESELEEVEIKQINT
jgi:5S rRNA maturation endonuclease (ribonuclease M5)